MHSKGTITTRSYCQKLVWMWAKAETNAQSLYVMLQPKGHAVLKKKKKIPIGDKLTFQNYKMYKEIIHFMQKSMERRLDFQNINIYKVTKVVASRMLKMLFKWKHYREKQDF